MDDWRSVLVDLLIIVQLSIYSRSTYECVVRILVQGNLLEYWKVFCLKSELDSEENC